MIKNYVFNSALIVFRLLIGIEPNRGLPDFFVTLASYIINMEEYTINWNLVFQIGIPTILAVVSLGWNALQQYQIENIKTESLKSLHVHKLQFDKEFEIYKELWAKLVMLKVIVNTLRPQVDSSDPKKTYKETITERLSNAVVCFNETTLIVLHNKPFYPLEIFNLIEPLLKKCHKEFIEVEFKPDRTPTDYWDEGKS
jgi:hypothetical protein